MKTPTAWVVLGLLVARGTVVQDVVAVQAAEVKWAEAKGHPKGVQSCLLHGNPAKEPFVILLKVPAGTVWPPHLHSADEVVVVQSGALTVGIGEKMEDAKGVTVDAGGCFKFKAKTPHWAKSTADTVIARYASGPGDINFCNSTDDPSRK